MTLDEKTTKPIKILPTDRVSTDNFLSILRAYAIASKMGKQLASRQGVADLVKLNASTVTLTNAFFVDIGFIQKNGKKFVVADEVIAFARAYDWNPENAGNKLAPLIKNSWFGEVLLDRLSFEPMSRDQAIQVLADESGANPKHRSKLETLIDLIQVAGLIEINGDQINIVKNGNSQEGQTERRNNVTTANVDKSNIRTTPMQSLSPTDGVVQFHVSVKVDMDELKGWQADRIAAFFNGIAQVLAAKENKNDLNDN